LVALRSLSLKPFSFGYKTPPIRFSQAGGQSAHNARPPNLELALTPLLRLIPEPVHTYQCTLSDRSGEVAPVVQQCIGLRYDTRGYFNVRSKADVSQFNLPHGTEN